MAVALACSLALVSGPRAWGDTVDEKRKADAKVAQLQDSVDGVSAQLAAAYNALQATTAQLPAARAALDQAQAAARAAQQHSAEVATQLAVATADEARAQDSLTRASADQDRTQRTLDAFAAQLFQDGGGSQLSVALGATSADDFATRIVLADTVSSLTAQSIDQLAAAKADGAATQAYLEAVRLEVVELKRQADAALTAARVAQAAAQNAKDQLDALVATQTAQTATLESQKSAEQQQLAQAEADQAALQAQLVEQARKAKEAAAAAAAAAARAGAAGAGAPPAARASGGFLSYPAVGPITSGFGMRYHPILHIYRLHSGTDFGIACGTPVYAAAPGTVISAGWAGGYGNRVMIDHGIQRGVDLVTTYNHLTSIVVGRGAVARGQLIAYSGTTGLSTGCHLHFETLADGGYVDPMGWL